MEGIERLREQVDTLIMIPNEKLLQIVERRTTILEAFREADDMLRQGVQGITDLITIPGLINLDFADVRTIMHDAGSALMGIGTAPARTAPPRRRRTRSPRRCSSSRSRAPPGILLNITGGDDLGLFEVNEAAEDRRRPPTRTRTSSSAPWSTTRWATRSASPSSPPASRASRCSPAGAESTGRAAGAAAAAVRRGLEDRQRSARSR